MSDVLFIHSPNMHEAHRMFAETIGADFEPAYVLEGGMPMFPVYLKKRKDIKVLNKN